MTIMEALDTLDNLFDESDPDVSVYHDNDSLTDLTVNQAHAACILQAHNHVEIDDEDMHCILSQVMTELTSKLLPYFDLKIA